MSRFLIRQKSQVSYIMLKATQTVIFQEFHENHAFYYYELLSANGCLNITLPFQFLFMGLIFRYANDFKQPWPIFEELPYAEDNDLNVKYDKRNVERRKSSDTYQSRRNWQSYQLQFDSQTDRVVSLHAQGALLALRCLQSDCRYG